MRLLDQKNGWTKTDELLWTRSTRVGQNEDQWHGNNMPKCIYDTIVENGWSSRILSTISWFSIRGIKSYYRQYFFNVQLFKNVE
jgi:hypothetical protein